MAESVTEAEPETPLQRYERSMRRRRGIYYAVLAVIVLALGTVFSVVWATGDAAHATLRTVSHQPANLALGTPSRQQTVAWRTTDRTALGTAQWNGTVITYSAHTVGGRDARTGARTWTYTRSNHTVCDVVQLAGVTVAVYDRDGTCDEISAFDSGTGARKWTRTLDEDGQPVEGRPAYQFTNSTLMAWTRSAIYAIDPGGGIDRWTYSRYGCAIEHVVLGSAGALISQDCSSAVRCTGISYCRQGQQLLLRDGSATRLDKDKKNFDQITWNDYGDTGVPVSADGVVSAAQPGSNVLDVFVPGTGKRAGTVELDPAPSGLDDVVAHGTQATEIIWIDGHVTALPVSASTPLWTAATSSAPTVVDAAGDETPVLSSARVTALSSSGVVDLDPTTGTVARTYSIDAPTSGGTVVPLGTGFLVHGPSGTVAYR